MRLDKAGFKKLLKECLREILKEEGMLQLKENNSTQASNFRTPSNDLLTNPRKPSEDKPQISSMFKENIDMLSRVTGGKKSNLFAQILEDTAMTTYQKQSEPGVHGNVAFESNYSEEEAQAELAELKEFSSIDDMTHWAKVAFAKK